VIPGVEFVMFGVLDVFEEARSGLVIWVLLVVPSPNQIPRKYGGIVIGCSAKSIPTLQPFAIFLNDFVCFRYYKK
jgi:hypothetical protein